jgi:hypothetical protein
MPSPVTDEKSRGGIYAEPQKKDMVILCTRYWEILAALEEMLEADDGSDRAQREQEPKDGTATVIVKANRITL